MADPTLAVWDAVYQLVSAELACEVFDFVPHGANRPHVLMAGVKSAVSDSRGVRRDICLVDLIAKSAEPGQHEVLGLIGQIDEALHDKRPNLSTGRPVVFRIVEKTTAWEADTESFIGRVTVKCTVEH